MGPICHGEWAPAGEQKKELTREVFLCRCHTRYHPRLPGGPALFSALRNLDIPGQGWDIDSIKYYYIFCTFVIVLNQVTILEGGGWEGVSTGRGYMYIYG